MNLLCYDIIFLPTNPDMFVSGDFNFDYNNPDYHKISKEFLEKKGVLNLWLSQPILETIH